MPMKIPEERLDATCRLSEAERRRLLAAISADDGARSKVDSQRWHAAKTWVEPVIEVGSHENEHLVNAPATRIGSRPYVCKFREKDFNPCSNCRPALVGWIAFMASVMRMFKPRSRQPIRNSVGIIVDQPILDLLGITPETDLDLTTDGANLVITPRFSSQAGARRTAKAVARTLQARAVTFRKRAL
jgi:antitoxin MazE